MHIYWSQNAFVQIKTRSLCLNVLCVFVSGRVSLTIHFDLRDVRPHASKSEQLICGVDGTAIGLARDNESWWPHVGRWKRSASRVKWWQEWWSHEQVLRIVTCLNLFCSINFLTTVCKRRACVYPTLFGSFWSIINRTFWILLALRVKAHLSWLLIWFYSISFYSCHVHQDSFATCGKLPGQRAKLPRRCHVSYFLIELNRNHIRSLGPVYQSQSQALLELRSQNSIQLGLSLHLLQTAFHIPHSCTRVSGHSLASR